MQASVRPIAALLTALLLGGCGKDTSPVEPDPTGTFAAVFGGSLADTTTGPASFGNPSGLHVVRMMRAQPAASVDLVSEFGGRLATGEHVIQKWNEGIPHAFVDLVDGMRYNSVAGRVVIYTSTPTSLTGTFNISFVGSALGDTMTVYGKFNAKCARGNIITCEE